MNKILYEGFKLERKYVDLEDCCGNSEEEATICLTKDLPLGYGDSLIQVTLIEKLQEFKNLARDSKKENIYLGYFITKKPLSWQECQSKQAEIVLGFTDLEVEVYHRYSDLTGYLWTEQTIEHQGHDVLKELEAEIGNYITLLFTY